MAIEIHKEFVIAAPAARVWAHLINPYRVSRCLPGSTITGEDGDEYTGTIEVELAGQPRVYRGVLRYERVDEASHTAELSAEGRDTDGHGTADMSMTSWLTADGDGTRVHITSVFNVTGMAARIGRGPVEAVYANLFEQCAACLAETVVDGEEGEAPAVPVETGPAEPPPSESQPKESAPPATAAVEAETPDAADTAPEAVEPVPEAPSPASEVSAPETPAAAAPRPGLARRSAGRLVKMPEFWVVTLVLVVVLWILLR